MERGAKEDWRLLGGDNVIGVHCTPISSSLLMQQLLLLLFDKVRGSIAFLLDVFNDATNCLHIPNKEEEEDMTLAWTTGLKRMGWCP